MWANRARRPLQEIAEHAGGRRRLGARSRRVAEMVPIDEVPLLRARFAAANAAKRLAFV
jgi:hypothetical protein